MFLIHRISSCIKRSTVPAAIASLAIVSGCAREEIRVYQTPKEAGPVAAKPQADPHAGLSMMMPSNHPAGMAGHPPVPGHPPMAGHPPVDGHPPVGGNVPAGADQNPEATWNVPAGWSEREPTPMVYKIFSAGGEGDARATISVTILSGDAGGTLANVNRWRGQLGQEPVAAADIDKMAQPIDAAGDKGSVFEINGTDARTGKPAQMVVAIVPHGGQTWFYKMLGDESVTKREKANFLTFVRSVRYP